MSAIDELLASAREIAAMLGRYSMLPTSWPEVHRFTAAVAAMDAMPAAEPSASAPAGVAASSRAARATRQSSPATPQEDTTASAEQPSNS